MDRIKTIPNPGEKPVLQANENPELYYSNIKEMIARSLEELSFEFNPVKDWKFRPVYSLVDRGGYYAPVREEYISDFYINNIFKIEDGEMDLNNVMKDKISYSSIMSHFKANASNEKYNKKDLFYISINKIIDNNFDNLYETEWKYVSDKEMDKILILLEKDLKMLLTDPAMKGVI